MRYIIIYLISVNFITAVITVYDKIAAKRSKRRISEKTLFLLALAGGSAAEYTAMRIIRHKTLHKRFMLGLPAIILLQLTSAFILIYFLENVNLQL